MSGFSPGDGQDLLGEPMRSRWSPSVFDDRHELGDTDVEALLQAARWAPTCGNAQPAHLLVARRGDAGHALLVSHLSRGNAGWVPRASAERGWRAFVAAMRHDLLHAGGFLVVGGIAAATLNVLVPRSWLAAVAEIGWLSVLVLALLLRAAWRL